MRTAFPALLAIFIALAPQARAAAPCQAGKKPCPAAPAAACHCRPGAAQATSRNWALQRPSTEQERAETERLNREFRAASQTPVAPAATPAAPPARAAENAPPPAPHGSQLEQYLELRRAYDRQLWAYYRAFPPRDQSYAYAVPQPPSAPAPRGDEARWQDRSRLDPWHGYNPGPANGF